MIVKVWNKKSPINGVKAENILADNPLFMNGEVILIMNDTGSKVREIHSVEILKANLNITGNYTALEIGSLYLQSLSVEEKEPDEKLQRIEQLEKENADIYFALMMGGLI